MADKRYNLVFDAKLEIGQIKQAIGQINQSLNSTSVNLPKGISSALEKTLKTVQAELLKMEGLSGEKLTLQNSKEIGKSYETILRNFQTLKVLMSDIKGTSTIDPEKLFPSEIVDKIKGANDALKAYKAAIEKGPKTEAFQQLTKEIAAAQKKYEELNSKISTATSKQQTTKSVRQQIDEEKRPYQEIIQLAEKEAQAADRVIAKSKEKLKLKKSEATITKAITVEEEKLQNAQERAAEIQAKMDSKKRKDTKVYADLEADLAKQKEKIQQSEQLITQYQQERDAIVELNKEIAAAERTKTAALTQGREAQKKVNELERRGTTKDDQYRQATADLQLYTDQAKKTEEEIRRLQEEKKRMEQAFSQGAMNTLVEEFKKLGIEIPQASRNLGDIQKILDNLSVGAVQKLEQELNKAGASLEDFGLDLTRIGNKKQELDKLTDAQKKFNDGLEMVKSRITYFFGLTNSVNLLKRALSGAFETVKELDAQMVETAVVTDFSVSDMWEKLPEYTKQAGTLGAKVIDLYDATTLYYQQGLKTNEAVALGTETIKMARIAGMESAEATEAMTAALRGFNMELNETSATRVNDVYSELAAVTAADTEQIATAMGKTASIAASANMEFETTAALLAQIIETTQEAPETAGTAMKTIIARFTEVKELFSQGQLTGEDSEGEEININKIDAALKTVGISLKDFLNGSKGIDDIFLELGAKWDSLDLATQRYIATMAAGSRQQSRFIAMMSDHERTMELVSAANNSAGASQKQFEKTMEGLQASLNKLSNAWEEFLMGLANKTVIKDVIDLLTSLLQAINWVSSVGGHAGGAETLILRLGLTAGGFKLAKVALNKGLASLMSSFSTAGATAGGRFWGAFKGAGLTKKQASKLIDFENLWGTEGKNFVNDFDKVTDGLTHDHDDWSKAVGNLGKQYNLTSAEISSFTQHIKEGGKAADWAKTHYAGQTAELARNEEQLKRNNAAQLKSITTTLALVATIYLITKAAEIAKKTIDKSVTTTKEKMEGLEKVEEGLIKETEKLQDTLNNFSDIRTGFDDMIDQVKDLRRGTAEWASTMHSARTQIYDILQTYPDLRNYVEEINGIQTLSEAGWIEYEKQLINDLYKTEILLAQNQAQQQSVKDVQAAENLKLPTNTISAKEAAAIEKGTTTGTYIGGATGAVSGWIAGTAIGAKAGTAVGTAIAPGLGTLIGALAGVLLGALIGHIAGGGMSATEGVSVDAINNVALEAARDENFSAETASRNEIKQFVEDLGYTGEELNALTDYIEKNRKEFDAHSQAMAQSQDQMISYGKQIGSILADEKGYTGKDKAYFESMGGFMYGELYDEEKEYQKSLLTGDAQDYIELAAQSGKFKYDADLEKIYDLEGNIIELTDEQIINLAAGVKAAEALTEQLEQQYNFAKGKGALEWQTFMADSSSIGDYSIEYLLDGLQEDLNKVKTQYSSFLEDNNRTYQEWGDFFRLQGKDVGFTLEGEYNYNRGTPQDRYAYSSNKKFSFTPEPSQTAGADTEELLKLYIKESGIPTTYGGGKLEFFNGEWKYSEKLIQQRIIEYAAEQGIILSQQLVSEMLKGSIETETLSQLFREEELRDYFTIDNVDYSTQFAEGGNLEFLREFQAGMVKSFLESVHALSDIDYKLDVNEHFLNPLKKVYEALEKPDDTGEVAGEAVKKQVLNGLMSLDSQDIRDAGFLKSLKTSLTQLAGTSEEADAAINEYIDGLIETGVAISKIDIETLTKQLEATFGILDKIEGLGANDELKLTKEELDALANSALDFDTSKIRKDFFATGDGFVYLGENIETLKDIIIDANEQLLGIQTTAIQKKVDQGKFINNTLMGKYVTGDIEEDFVGPLTSTQEMLKDVSLDWDTVETWTATNMSEATYAIVEAVAAERGMTGEELLKSDELRALLVNTPLERLEYDVIEGLYKAYKNSNPEEAANAAAEVFTQLSGGEATARQYFIDAADAAENQVTNEKMLETGMSELRQEALSHYSIDQLTNMDPSKIIGKEEYDKTVTYNEETGRYENPEGKEVFMQEDIDLAIKNRLAERDLTSFRDQLVDQGIEQDAAARIVDDNADLNEGLGEIMGSYDDWTALIDENTGLIKATTAEDVAAYDKLKESTKKMLNTSEDLSDSFWNNSKNIENMKKAAEGDTEALEELQKAAAQDYLVQIATEVEDETARNAILTLSDFIVNTELPALEAGVKLEDADFIARCNDLIAASNMTSEQVSKAFKEMGYDVEFDPNPQPVTQDHVVPVTSYQIDYDEQGNITGMTPTVEMQSFPYTSTVAAPTIKTLTSYGSGGGGVSIKNQDTGKAIASKSKKKGGGNDWKNPYDKQYNTNKKINEALRQREKLERRYSKLIEKNQATADKLVASVKEELAVLAREQELQEKMISNRKQQIEEYISQKGLTKYAYLGENEFTGESELRINWDEINKISDQERGKEVEEYISQLEEWFDSIEEVQDSLEDIEDAVDEIKKRGEDEYFELEDKIKDAVVQFYQDQIDKLSEINNTITDSDAKIIESMQQAINKEREARENKQTEEELSDKQRRLLYLKQDTSGGNELEILKLQEELDQGYEDYTDTLIDQKINELQEQNDKAAEQRQQQIDIANEQLRHWKESGGVWDKVYELMKTDINTELGNIIPGSELETILKKADNWDGLSTLAKDNWFSPLNATIAQAFSYLKTGRQLENMEEYLGKAGKKITFTTSDGVTLTGITDEHGNVKVGNQTYSGVYQNFDGGFRTDETTKKQEVPQKVGNDKHEEKQTGEVVSESKKSGRPSSGGSTLAYKKTGLKPDQVKELQTWLKKEGYYSSGIDGKYGPGTQEAVRQFWKKEYGEVVEGHEGYKTYDKFKRTTYSLLTGRSAEQADTSGGSRSSAKGKFYYAAPYKGSLVDPDLVYDKGGVHWLVNPTIKGKKGAILYDNYIYKIDRFKTGGLADYTGPAWLDGTKSKPELVLNAQDTQNFIQLKNVLASLMSRPMQTSENSGDNTYDIDINVESIGSDYDVEQLAEKIKSLINKDARYRNNNTINFMR